MTAPKLIQKIEIFVSSPGDVMPEREAIARVVERLNRLAYIRERYYLQLMAYEEYTPPVVGMPPQTVVDQYMLKAEHSDILICVMWARMGTPVTHPETGERYQSGTEYEFLSAYRANQRTGKPHILLYQKAARAPDADPDQNAKVHAFFRRFEGDGAELKGLYKRFTVLEQFEEMVFEDLEAVITRNLIQPTQAKLISETALPKFKEETRRLDAAMPEQTKVGRPTEVWVQICLPSSSGFRDRLPQFTKHRDEIKASDVRAGSLAVAFPIDSATGKPTPIRASIELRAADFEIGEPRQEVILTPRADSGLVVFNLTPKQPRDRSIVHVVVRQTMPDGVTVTLGSTALSTQVHGAGFVLAAAQVAWTLLSLPLAALDVRRSMALPGVELEEAEAPPLTESARETGGFKEAAPAPEIDDPYGLFDADDREYKPLEAETVPLPPEPQAARAAPAARPAEPTQAGAGREITRESPVLSAPATPSAPPPAKRSGGLNLYGVLAVVLGLGIALGAFALGGFTEGSLQAALLIAVITLAVSIVLTLAGVIRRRGD